jgi:hypothetical protein
VRRALTKSKNYSENLKGVLTGIHRMKGIKAFDEN